LEPNQNSLGTSSFLHVCPPIRHTRPCLFAGGDADCMRRRSRCERDPFKDRSNFGSGNPGPNCLHLAISPVSLSHAQQSTMVASMNSFAALAGEVASSKAVEGQGDVQVKVHHPPRRSDSKGWTTVQSGRKQKGGKIVSQAEAKPAGKKPAGKEPAGKKPAGKNACESGRKNKGGQNSAQAGAKPAGKTRVPVTLGVFFDGAKYCPWKKPAVAAVVAETSRPAIVASWPTPQEAYPAMVEAKTATTEVEVEVEVKTTATAPNKKRRNKKKRQQQQQQPSPSTSGPVPSTVVPVAEPAQVQVQEQVQNAELASLGVEAELREEIRSLREALAAREEKIDTLSKQLDSTLSWVASMQEKISKNSPNNSKAIEDASCGTPTVPAATASPLKMARQQSTETDEEMEMEMASSSGDFNESFSVNTHWMTQIDTREQLARYVEDHSDDPNLWLPDANGRNALHWLAILGKADLVWHKSVTHLDRKEFFTGLDNDGKTPEDLAALARDHQRQLQASFGMDINDEDWGKAHHQCLINIHILREMLTAAVKSQTHLIQPSHPLA